MTNNPRVRIVACHYNTDLFIRAHKIAFERFVLDDYEYIAFNDARDVADVTNFNDAAAGQRIEAACRELNVRHFRVPPEIHTRPYVPRLPGEDPNHPCRRCANITQFMYDEAGRGFDGILVVMDGDLVPVAPISFAECLHGGSTIIGYPQSRTATRGGEPFVVDYFWAGMVICDMGRLKDPETLDFNCGRVYDTPVDVGGYTHLYIDKHRTEIGWLNAEALTTHSRVSPALTVAAEELLADALAEGAPSYMVTERLFHYGSVSNWDYRTREHHEKRQQRLMRFLAEYASGGTSPD